MFSIIWNASRMVFYILFYTVCALAVWGLYTYSRSPSVSPISSVFDPTCHNPLIAPLPFCHAQNKFSRPRLINDGKIDTLQQVAITLQSFVMDMSLIRPSIEEVITSIDRAHITLRKVRESEDIITALRKLSRDDRRLQMLLVEFNVSILEMVQKRLFVTRNLLWILRLLDQSSVFSTELSRWLHLNEVIFLPKLINQHMKSSKALLASASAKAETLSDIVQYEKSITDRAEILLAEAHKAGSQVFPRVSSWTSFQDILDRIFRRLPYMKAIDNMHGKFHPLNGL